MRGRKRTRSELIFFPSPFRHRQYTKGNEASLKCKQSKHLFTFILYFLETYRILAVYKWY